ncbi:MAG: o-succinylbenzoate synthase [Bacteroidaceae bacterium]|nr:o-succinylbenzoate synthase [Bacteroidaceae bacterium]
MKIDIKPYTLRFKFRAGTSRGTYTEHKVKFIKIVDEDDPSHIGIGEYAPLPDLSPDTSSAMLFAHETALWHYHSRSKRLSDTPFSRGECGIPINGLIWMGDYDTMKARIEEKLSAGFRCVKMKIGAINFDDEVSLLRQIRSRFPREVIELRVDANGAFQPGDDAMRKLDTLAQLDLHSIEQPIRAGQWEEMAKLCQSTPLPIALDEELIPGTIPGTAFESYTTEYKISLLDAINPQYIILKPSLHGALTGCDEWIHLATERNIGWWATSALESNVGLNAIAHWVAKYQPTMPQGLGTGQIYENNIDGYPIFLNGDEMWCRKNDMN